MARFRDLSIRSKLMTGFMRTSLAAYDRMTFRAEALRDIETLAGIIGENASSSVAFNDRQTARATLEALRALPLRKRKAPRWLPKAWDSSGSSSVTSTCVRSRSSW
jgi:hypothetical protein